MKILVRNSDSAVIHADSGLTLTATECRGDGWRDGNFNASNSAIQEVDLPEYWIGGAWGYNGHWFVIDQKAIDQLRSEDDARKATESRGAAKEDRAKRVDQIRVTTSSGKTFDGDEISQGRMARGILGLQAAGATSVTWVLADNTPTTVTVEELGEALALAGAAQAAVWVIA